jgi:FkbM family methyltransferase
MLSKNNKKTIKVVLIKLGIWNLLKMMRGNDKGEPLNKNLLVDGKIFYGDFIKSGDLVFDVGANFGNRVEIFVALDAKVVAIEPQFKCVRFLKNRYGNSIFIENVGLGSKNETKLFYEADNSVFSTFSSSYIEKVERTRHKTSIWKESDYIQVVTLDELIVKYGNPDFIKIDVEGYELEVLQGLNDNKSVISFEYNVPELTDELFKCIERLNKIGYAKFSYSVEESMKLSDKWYSYKDFLNIISSKDFLNTTFGDIYVKV